MEGLPRWLLGRALLGIIDALAFLERHSRLLVLLMVLWLAYWLWQL